MISCWCDYDVRSVSKTYSSMPRRGKGFWKQGYFLTEETACLLHYAISNKCSGKSFCVHFSVASTFKNLDYLSFQYCCCNIALNILIFAKKNIGALLNKHFNSLFFLYSFFVYAPCLKATEIEFALIYIPSRKSYSEVVWPDYVCLHMSFIQVLQRYHQYVGNGMTNEVS